MAGVVCTEEQNFIKRSRKDNSPPFRAGEKRKSSISDIELLQDLLVLSGDDFFAEGGALQTHAEQINSILDSDFTWGLLKNIGIPIINAFLEKDKKKIENLVDILDNLTEKGNGEAISILRRRGLTQKSGKNMFNLMVELANEHLEDGEQKFETIM